MFPLLKIFDANKIDYKYIHTGQHYDYNLSLQYIEDLMIRKPDYKIQLDKTTSESGQVAQIISKVGNILQRLDPSLVLIQGDTNSALGAAISSLKLKIHVAHLEAGLRNEDWTSTEEQNRRIIDHISNILFAPTKNSARNLQTEQVHGKIYVVGNTIMDAIKLCQRQFRWDHIDRGLHSINMSSPGLSRAQLKLDGRVKNNFVLVTLHRAENVDNPRFLKQLITAMSSSEFEYLFPIHPRTLKRIKEFQLDRLIGKNMKIIYPVGYLNFLRLLKECKFVITDSGGIEEEITSPLIDKQAIILRNSTERPETVESGHGILYQIDNGPKKFLEIIKRLEVGGRMRHSKSPYGDGNTAQRILKILQKK